MELCRGAVPELVRCHPADPIRERLDRGDPVAR